MTKFELVNILSQLPNDVRIMINSGWDFVEDINTIWYNAELNEVFLTQESKSEKNKECYTRVKNKTYHFISLY